MKKVLLSVSFLLIALHLPAQELRVAVVDFRGDGVDQATAGRVSELMTCPQKVYQGLRENLLQKYHE